MDLLSLNDKVLFENKNIRVPYVLALVVIEKNRFEEAKPAINDINITDVITNFQRISCHTKQHLECRVQKWIRSGFCFAFAIVFV